MLFVQVRILPRQARKGTEQSHASTRCRETKQNHAGPQELYEIKTAPVVLMRFYPHPGDATKQ